MTVSSARAPEECEESTLSGGRSSPAADAGKVRVLSVMQRSDATRQKESPLLFSRQPRGLEHVIGQHC